MHQLSAVPISPNHNNVRDSEDARRRRSVTYHPSVWGDYFLKYTSHVTEISVAENEELERQKEMVLAQIQDDSSSSAHKLQLIDAIQRLGVAYHFEQEIEESLRRIYDEEEYENNDLHLVALRFRLLRQQGYYVPCDVFNKFVDEEGNFKESVANDVEAMLSLYEAAHLGVNGEDILDKAVSFCSSRLESCLVHRNYDYLSKQISEALIMPIRKSVVRLGARKFISIYQENESHNKILLNFAQLDFNIVQKIHQKELSHLTRWWKDLDFANRLPFARDRMVECYFWILAVYFEPQYHLARRILTKIIALSSVADDIYDVHGTLDELQLFTDFIQSWDVNALAQLPQYMRIYSRALLDVYAEIEDEMGKIGTSYRVHYAKEEMKKLMRVYLEEAKWYYSKYMPATMEEYMNVALASAGYMMASTISLVGMQENLVTKEHFDWITSEPLIVRAASATARLMDDIVGYGSEEKISAVDCYMNENGCSKTEAFAELEKQVRKASKDINQECLIGSTTASLPILSRVLNLTRLINLLYSGEDGYTNSQTKTKEIIKRVLVEPVTV